MPSWPRPRLPRINTDVPLEEQFAEVDRMTPEQRLEAMFRGEFTYAQLGHWSARYPHEVPIVNGEFWWIVAHLDDVLEPDEPLAHPTGHGRDPSIGRPEHVVPPRGRHPRPS
jgi:hypothetical protein